MKKIGTLPCILRDDPSATGEPVIGICDRYPVSGSFWRTAAPSIVSVIVVFTPKTLAEIVPYTVPVSAPTNFMRRPM